MHCRKRFLESVKPDVVFGTESWLDGNILNSEVFPENFTAYRKDRVNNPHGGVFLLVDSSIISSEETSLVVEGIELVWAKISSVGSKDLLLGSFYRPPATDGAYLEKLNNSLSRLTNSNSNIRLSDDFNLPYINWHSDSVTPSCKNSSLHSQLIDTANSFSLTQVVTKSTRGKNTLDLFFTNNDTLVNRVETIPDMSDLDIVFVESELAPKRAPIPKRKLILYNKGELKSFEKEFNEIDKNNMTTSELWSMFTEKMNELIEKHIPTKISTKTHKLPYFNRELSRLNKTLHKAYRNRNLNPKANKHKSVKALFQRKLRKSYRDYVE